MAEAALAWKMRLSAEALLRLKRLALERYSFLDGVMLEELAGHAELREVPVLVRFHASRETVRAMDACAHVAAMEARGDVFRDFSLPTLVTDALFDCFWCALDQDRVAREFQRSSCGRADALGAEMAERIAAVRCHLHGGRA